MSSFPITLGFDNPDPLDKTADFAAFVALLNELISAEIEGAYVSSVVGSAVPGVDDQDKIWYRTDGQGRPIGTYHFYNGAWRREYDHRIGEIVAYSGNPAVDFAAPGHRGTVGGEWDGFQLCSGENGSPNFTNKFIVGAKMDDLAIGFPDTHWKTTVDGTTQQEGLGGTEMALTLHSDPIPATDVTEYTPGTEDNVPRPARAELRVGRWDSEVLLLEPPGDLYGFPQHGTFPELGVVPNVHVLIPGEPGIPAISFPTLPNYYALAYAIFLGYA